MSGITSPIDPHGIDGAQSGGTIPFQPQNEKPIVSSPFNGRDYSDHTSDKGDTLSNLRPTTQTKESGLEAKKPLAGRVTYDGLAASREASTDPEREKGLIKKYPGLKEAVDYAREALGEGYLSQAKARLDEVLTRALLFDRTGEATKDLGRYHSGLNVKNEKDVKERIHQVIEDLGSLIDEEVAAAAFSDIDQTLLEIEENSREKKVPDGFEKVYKALRDASLTHEKALERIMGAIATQELDLFSKERPESRPTDAASTLKSILSGGLLLPSAALAKGINVASSADAMQSDIICVNWIQNGSGIDESLNSEAKGGYPITIERNGEKPSFKASREEEFLKLCSTLTHFSALIVMEGEEIAAVTASGDAMRQAVRPGGKDVAEACEEHSINGSIAPSNFKRIFVPEFLRPFLGSLGGNITFVESEERLLPISSTLKVPLPFGGKMTKSDVKTELSLKMTVPAYQRELDRISNQLPGGGPIVTHMVRLPLSKEAQALFDAYPHKKSDN